MNTAVTWHSAAASDPGLRRSVNEDRVFTDDARGVFLVVDGMGGHAAGEIAAETAVRTIEQRLGTVELHSDAEAMIREAITEANNRIYELAGSRSEWRGMACVLTLAVVQEDRVTFGHVGDSRLYLFWNGQLKKLTSDHSPVGEQEDQGALTEEQAMKHPRRNEVFRDVGSVRRTADEANFIETKSVPFRPDAALLVASDGLSDVLTSAEIAGILERYDGVPEKAAQALIEAANRAGGVDNVSVVFVPGPEFLGSRSEKLSETRPRHAITRLREDQPLWRRAVRNTLWLLAGAALGAAGWYGLQQSTRPAVPAREPLVVNAADAHGIQKALESAHAGDTIEIPAGNYLGPLELREGINLVGQAPGLVKLRSDPGTPADAGFAIVAKAVRRARVEGLQVMADDTHPLRTGVWMVNSSVELADLDISGAIEAGIRIEGSSAPVLLANVIHANAGPGVMIKKGSAPRLAGNWITDNGKVPNELRAGIEIENGAAPSFGNNVVLRNGVAGK